MAGVSLWKEGLGGSAEKGWQKNGGQENRGFSRSRVELVFPIVKDPGRARFADGGSVNWSEITSFIPPVCL